MSCAVRGDCPQTSRNTITLTDGRRYRVRTRDSLARVSGPVELFQVTEPDGEWYEDDGPAIAWFRLVGGVGWTHNESGQHDADSVRLALRIINQIGATP